MGRISPAAIAAALLLTALPAISSAADAPVPLTWFGFTTGQPVASFRAAMGDPLTVTSTVPSNPPSGTDVIQRHARFLVSANGNVFGVVSEDRGLVRGLELFAAPVASSPRLDIPADPNGVHLGDDEASLVARLPNTDHHRNVYSRADDARGMWANYEIESGRVADIFWYTRGDHGAQPGPGSYVERAGDTDATAILDVQKNDRETTLWQRYYYTLHPCDGKKGGWREASTAIKRDATHVYDDNTVICSTTGKEREFWFDITAGYGKS